ncbi:MAG TPA: hypothetical protein PLQ89_21645 [Phycisphaerae bacterium]|nr:hypothetical protein [Phycisphaerae bacterium]HOM51417.1 hypothetical protein [Phycisphaerae bacterium]HOQ88316.1 hypothetical protein [Phycisphaerae bacterium]HPU28336.1 hypothetical protein [Phycisphaerae bacterium]
MLGIAAAAGLCLVPWAPVSIVAIGYLLFWVPGRLLVQLLRPLRHEPGWRWGAWAASLMLMPVVLHWAWWLSNSRGAILAAVVLTDAALALAVAWAGDRRAFTSPLFREPAQLFAFAFLLIWVAAAVFLFNWLPVAGGRSIPSPSGDYVKHHAIIWSLEQYPLPLHNVFFAAQSDAPYYYYEQFHLLPAAIRVLSAGAVRVETAFGIAAAAAAVALTAMVFLVARGLLGAVWPALLAAACATVIGGWDVIATTAYCLHIGRPMIVLDAWCPVLWRTHNIMNSFIWCPQHIAALATFLLCCHWLQIAPNRQWWIAVGPLAAASIFGASAYMALFCFAGAAVYVATRFVNELRQPRASVGRFTLAIVAMAVLSAALMGWRALHYQVMSARFGGGVTLEWDRFPFAFLGRAVAPGVLANWMEAPWLVPVEFGLGAVAIILVAGPFWRRVWRDDGARLLAIVAFLGFVTLWTVRTGINSIDYAYRMGSMVTLVLGALATGALLEPALVRPFARGWRKPVLVVGIVLGLPVGFYEPPLLAVRTFIEPNPDGPYAGAAAYVREATPPGAVAQPDPVSGLRLLQLTHRRAGVMDPSDPHVNVLCPPDKPRMQEAMVDIESAFRTPDAEQAHRLFGRWGVTYVLAGPRERERYGDLAALADSRYFDIVYDDGQTRVYRLAESR